MERFASMVLPWPYEVPEGSKRRVSSNWALGVTWLWFLKTRTWLWKRASRMTSNWASVGEHQQVVRRLL